MERVLRTRFRRSAYRDFASLMGFAERHRPLPQRRRQSTHATFPADSSPCMLGQLRVGKLASAIPETTHGSSRGTTERGEQSLREAASHGGLQYFWQHRPRDGLLKGGRICHWSVLGCSLGHDRSSSRVEADVYAACLSGRPGCSFFDSLPSHDPDPGNLYLNFLYVG